MRFLKLPFIYWLLLNCIPFIGFELHSGNIKPGVFFYLGALTIITSGIWLFFCLYFFIKHNTSPNPHQTPRQLVTTGPYKISRNPMYFGFLDISIGLFFIFGNWGFLGAALAFYFITDRYTIVQEEKILSERFPQAWRQYCRHVRRWI
ncbi:TPA: isoprenylcysteine carboxylmethyltransferase family protein [Proteus mirabilis]|nr:isoprenylcysteine carboxylmethyltransferase family protein [Proteus mirabilis]HEK2141245.1 isoprenylcysteine carboxylmethyltransferase family protein [Proteus mirabilis]HEK2927541.1 isoprenylcysteine carboxylmethyltransferase family protein [Proteus mirabilis]